MGGCRCSYKNCKNTTKTSDSIHFFHYPVKHKERCKVWIENAEKPQFCDLEEEQLRNKVICEMHFEDKYFPNPQKKRLLHAAIPTLEGDCVPEHVPLEPSEFNDVTILPANADGTIFVLDTDSMFQNRVAASQKIESYIYKNGAIVPAKHGTNNYDDYIETANVNYNLPKARIVESYRTKVIQPKIEHLRQETTIFDVDLKEEIVDNGNLVEMAEDNFIAVERRPAKTVFDTKPSLPDLEPVAVQATPVVESRSARGGMNRQNNVKKYAIEKSVGRNYMNKIKQHSREIAHIKRMLKQKNLAEVPANESILKSLKTQLPSTLYTLVNLSLNSEYELTEEDATFFYDIKNTSPVLYQIFFEKYKWNMPRFADCDEVEEV